MGKQLNMLLQAEKVDALEFFAKEEHLPHTTLAKKIFLEAMEKFLVNESINLYAKGRIGLKKAWKLSGLSFFGFLKELEKRKIEPPLSASVQEFGEKVAKKIKREEIFSQ